MDGFRARVPAMLSIWLGCGLRRRELIDLTFEHIQRREEHWAIVDLHERPHIRTVPMPAWAQETLDDWLNAADIRRGRLSRRVCRKGQSGARRSLKKSSRA